MLRIKEVVKDLQCFNYMNYALTLTIKSTIYVSQREHVVLSHIRQDVLLLALKSCSVYSLVGSRLLAKIYNHIIFTQSQILKSLIYIILICTYIVMLHTSLNIKKWANTIYMPRIGVVLTIIMIFDSRQQIFVAVSHCSGF